MQQKAIIICESIYHGNTIKIAQAMAHRLSCQIMGYDEAIQANLESYEVIGLGSGIYFTRHHPKLFDVIKKLKPDQKVFVFSTRGNPRVGKYHQAIHEALKNHGIKNYGDFSSKGYDRTGPFVIFNGGNKGRPNEVDLEKADQFIKQKFPDYAFKDPKAPKGKNVYIDKERCKNCQACISICPMEVFELQNQNVRVKNELDCTHCSLCVNACMSHAIAIQHSTKELIGIAIRHKDRKSL